MNATRTATTLRSLLEDAADRIDAADGVGDPRPRVEHIAATVLGGGPGAIGEAMGRPPTEEHMRRVEELIRRVEAGEPAAYVLGRATFFGREFEVTRETLIPRTDTEELVRIVMEDVRARPLPERPLVLELCAGGGCVAITMACLLPDAVVVATDLSAEALEVADRNVRRHGLGDRVTLARGDLFEPAARVASGRPFDLIVSNPPYIPSRGIVAMGRAVAENEPRMALDGGDDGLDFHRRILAEAHRHLAPGGRVFLEHEHDQGEGALRIARQWEGHYEEVRVIRDSKGKDRALAVRRR